MFVVFFCSVENVVLSAGFAAEARHEPAAHALPIFDLWEIFIHISLLVHGKRVNS